MLSSLSTFPASRWMGNVYLWKIVIDSNDHNFLPKLIHICSSISNSLRPCLSREHRLSFTFILSFTLFYFVVLTFHSRFKFHLITSFAKRSSGFPFRPAASTPSSWLVTCSLYILETSDQAQRTTSNDSWLWCHLSLSQKVALEPTAKTMDKGQLAHAVRQHFKETARANISLEAVKPGRAT